MSAGVPPEAVWPPAGPLPAEQALARRDRLHAPAGFLTAVKAPDRSARLDGDRPA